MNGTNNTNGQNNALALNNNQSMLQVGGFVTNDDIVAIAIDAHEESVNLRKIHAERDMRSVQAEINAASKTLELVGPEILKTIKFDEAQAIAAQLNSGGFGGFGAFEAKVTLDGTNTEKKTWTYNVSVVKKADPKNNYSSDSVIVSKEVTVPFNNDAIILTAVITSVMRTSGLCGVPCERSYVFEGARGFSVHIITDPSGMTSAVWAYFGDAAGHGVPPSMPRPAAWPPGPRPDTDGSFEGSHGPATWQSPRDRRLTAACA